MNSTGNSQLMSNHSESQPADHRHRLDELPSATFGIVQHIDSGDAALRRLMAMGLCVGRKIKVVRQGHPLIVQLLGARIGVSERLARQIIVERCY